MELPLVSVIIPTHNRSDLLGRAIRSALAQDYSNVEIIVVDDHSTDDTPQIMQEFLESYPSIRYFRLQDKTGANAARNTGIASARGHFVSGLDDDDEFHPERISRLVASYREEYAFVFSGYKHIYGENHIMQIPQKEIYILKDILGINFIGNQILTTKKKIVSIGGYDENLLAAQDYDLWIRLLSKYKKAYCLRLPLYLFYFHSGSSITKSKNKFKGNYMFYKKHKPLMGLTHRKQQLALIYDARNKKIGIKNFLLLINKDQTRALASLFLRTNYPKLYRIIKGLRNFLLSWKLIL